MATEGHTWTQLQFVIILVAATMPLVYAFTHHGRDRENTLALWLPFVLFVVGVVDPTFYRLPADASLEWRLKWAAVAVLENPLSYAWPLLIWSIYFWRRRAGRASGRTQLESTEAIGQRAQRVEPIYLGVVVFLLIVLVVAAQAADQADLGAQSAQTAVVGAAAGETTWVDIIIVGLAVIAPPIYAFKHHGQDRIVSLVVWVPLWLFAAGVTYSVPRSRANSLEGRLEWALNELIANPATIQGPLYVFFVFGLIRLFSGARRDAFAQASQRSTTNGAASALRVAGESPQRPDDAERRPTPAANIKRCLGCGRAVHRDRRQCPFCHRSFAPVPASPPSTPVAAPLPSSDGGEWCSRCGVRVPNEANFCARCGYDLARQR